LCYSWIPTFAGMTDERSSAVAAAGKRNRPG
jgi:hypothetical protein